jgi:hypothetical protein
MIFNRKWKQLNKNKTMEKKMKIRSIMTGRIITVWQTTNHPDSSYNIPVWVDYKGRGYGQVIHWEVPFGFEKVTE